jgi:Tol biopolymer transport system component
MKSFLKTVLEVILGGLLFSGMYSCKPSDKEKTAIQIPYPSPMPDSTALSFLSGIISKDSLDFNAAFSPDGKSFYFTRSEKGKLKIYLTHYDGQKWIDPVRASFVESDYSEADPAFAPDGKLYFISNRPKDQSDTLPDYDIWRVAPLTDGNWSTPENVMNVNSDSSEFYVSFTEEGSLYFSSSRKGGYGEEDIYMSRWVNNQYASPENLGPVINSEKSEYDPFISPAGDFIVFTSSGRSDTFGAGDLYCSKLNSKRAWLPAINLGETFNTKTRDYCPYLSPDSRYFFYSSEKDVRWIDAGILKHQMDNLFKQD